MTEIEVVLTFLLVLAVFYGIVQRKKRKSAEAYVQDMKKRCSQLFGQRNALAREYLLHVIPKEKITEVKKRKHYSNQMNPNPTCSFGLEGLVASDLSLNEFLIMSKVDELLDGRIRRDGDRFEIPR